MSFRGGAQGLQTAAATDLLGGGREAGGVPDGKAGRDARQCAHGPAGCYCWKRRGAAAAGS